MRQNFIKSLLTNRLGLVLGTLNLCCIPIYGLFSFSFLTSKLLESLFISANNPAILASFLLGNFVKALFPILRDSISAVHLIPILILVQWLFIGCLSKIIAEKIKK